MIFEMVEITEASEGTDHHGGTEKRRMSHRVGQPRFARHESRGMPPRLRVSAVNRFLRTLR